MLKYPEGAQEVLASCVSYIEGVKMAGMSGSVNIDVRVLALIISIRVLKTSCG